MIEFQIKSMRDRDLMISFERSVVNDREATRVLLLHLNEIDLRRLYAEEGFSSLIDWLIKKWHYSESAAYRRVQAMRALRDMPEAALDFQEGRTNVSTLAKAQQLMRKEQKRTGQKISLRNKAEVLKAICDKSEKEAEKTLFSLLDVEETYPDQTRRVSANEVQIGFAADDQLIEKFDRLKEIWAHRNPNPTWGEFFNMMADLCLRETAPTKRRVNKRTARPASKSDTAPLARSGKNFNLRKRTYISLELKRRLWQRSESRCEYVDETSGRRCECKSGLQIDHKIPFAKGGTDTFENLRLLCRTHNLLFAEKEFGRRKIQSFLQPQLF